MQALEQVCEIEQPITASLQHLNLVIETFNKPAGLAVQEIIGDLLPMVIQRGQETLETLDGLHRDELPPRLQPLTGLGLGLSLLEDHRQHLAHRVRRAQRRRQLKQLLQPVTLLGLERRPGFAKQPQGALHPGLILVFRQFLSQALDFLLAHRIGTLPVGFGHMKAIHHHLCFRQLLVGGVNKAVVHIRTDLANRRLEPLRDRGQKRRYGFLAPIRQHRQQGELARAIAVGDDDPKVPVALTQGNLVNANHVQLTQVAPVHCLGHMPLHDACHRRFAQGVLTAGIDHRGVNQHAQHVLFERPRMGTVGRVPVTPLGRRRIPLAVRAAVAFGPDFEIHAPLEHRQMPQPQRLIMAMKLADLPPTAPAGGTLQGAFYADDQITPVGVRSSAPAPQAGSAAIEADVP